MQKKIQLPKEHLVEPEERAGRLIDSDDVEGHSRGRSLSEPDEFARRTPSSGGELSPSFPSTGGDVAEGDEV